MENIIYRHRNLTILVVVLFAQVLGLAVQVHKTTNRGSDRLLRIWAVSAITPFEKAVVHTTSWASNTWHDYFYLRDVRRQNQELRDEVQRLRLEQVRMAEDAGQARRLQLLLGFKEQFISQTMPAQVISTTGSEFSRGIYIDKGSRDGVKADMPVITPDGIVGKVLRVYPTSSLVLEINDPSSGAGAILEKSRLQGILKGSANGGTYVANIMADEKIEVGERVLSSGGDRVYPKGMAIGTVSKVTSAGTFLNVEVKPAALLDRLEEVLVITKVVEKTPEAGEPTGPVRAIDILTERLPSVPPPKPEDKGAIPPTTAELAAREKAAARAAAAAGATKPAAADTTPGAVATKPAETGTAGAVVKPKPTDASAKQQPTSTAATPQKANTTGAASSTRLAGEDARATSAAPAPKKLNLPDAAPAAKTGTAEQKKPVAPAVKKPAPKPAEPSDPSTKEPPH